MYTLTLPARTHIRTHTTRAHTSVEQTLRPTRIFTHLCSHNLHAQHLVDSLAGFSLPPPPPPPPPVGGGGRNSQGGVDFLKGGVEKIDIRFWGTMRSGGARVSHRGACECVRVCVALSECVCVCLAVSECVCFPFDT